MRWLWAVVAGIALVGCKPVAVAAPPGADVGRPATLAGSQWIVTIDEVATVAETDRGKKAGGVFVRLQLRFENLAGEPETFSVGIMELRDGARRVYQPEHIGGIVQKVNPGVTGSGTVWIDVPRTASDLTLYYAGERVGKVGNVADMKGR